jgi:hypothetical protein
MQTVCVYFHSIAQNSWHNSCSSKRPHCTEHPLIVDVLLLFAAAAAAPAMLLLLLQQHTLLEVVPSTAAEQPAHLGCLQFC